MEKELPSALEELEKLRDQSQSMKGQND